ncbi:hypothetical protein I5W30_04800 [Stenotrophomonas maltophilia]|uniref:hypothetical protein n=1 Tax=Stenotrophomonas maltophilia group sp. Smal13 TaxID=3377166 RepID=UPI00131332BE|nr:hypothetical protein [Stenotrophomonas maltophilia]MBH1873553.1 hypothetical protein [Stenotrophomonas maltophilia]
MSRSAWIAWVIAVTMILFGLWLVDHSFTGALMCIGVALLAMVWVVMDIPPRSARGG